MVRQAMIFHALRTPMQRPCAGTWKVSQAKSARGLRPWEFLLALAALDYYQSCAHLGEENGNTLAECLSSVLSEFCGAAFQWWGGFFSLQRNFHGSWAAKFL